MKRAIRDEAVIRLGGHIVSMYHAYQDEVEVILIVKAGGMFFAVQANGRQAHRSLKLSPGQMVEVEGPIVSSEFPADSGWKPILTIWCQRLRIGEKGGALEDPFSGQSVLSKFHLFRKCVELNG